MLHLLIMTVQVLKSDVSFNTENLNEVLLPSDDPINTGQFNKIKQSSERCVT